MIYFPMGAIAVLKGLYELFGKPFFWDKTSHGISHEEDVDLLGDKMAPLTPLPQTSDASRKRRSDAA